VLTEFQSETGQGSRVDLDRQREGSRLTPRGDVFERVAERQSGEDAKAASVHRPGREKRAPKSSTRSRIRIQAAACADGDAPDGAMAIVGHLQLDAGGIEAQAHRRRGTAAGVLERVRQRLLDDPVGGLVEQWRQGVRLTGISSGSRRARRRGTLDHHVQVGEADPVALRICGVRRAQQPSSLRMSSSAIPRGALDLLQHGARLVHIGAVVDRPQAGRRLQRDRGHAMAGGVVQGRARSSSAPQRRRGARSHPVRARASAGSRPSAAR